MFERAIPVPDATSAPAGALRAMDWAEIVARLDAARELGAVLHRVPQGGAFSPLTAAEITEFESEPAVNLNALACGKATSGNSARVVRVGERGERDTR